jgi:alkylation response protein AidB-like acyl-CoA dehydrogenase
VPEPAELESEESFAARARRFVEETLPTLPVPPASGDARPVHVLLDHSDATDASVRLARQWRRAKFDAGFGAITEPAEHGGAGLPEAYEALYADVEAQYAVPSEGCFAFGIEGVAPAIARFGSPRIRQQALPKIFRGDWIVCQLYSEPGAGSDLASLATRAAAAGRDWVVNGQKVWTSNAHRADVGILLCRTGTAQERHRGITAFLVDMTSPGIDIRPLRQMDGSAGFNEVFLTDVRVPDGRRLGEAGQGWTVAMSVQAHARGYRAMSQRRGEHGGLTAIASADRLADMMRRAGRADDAVLRQEWARLYTSNALLQPTAERLIAQAATTNDEAAARAVSKLGLASALSAAADLICAIQGTRIAVDTGAEDSFEWVPYILQTLGYHIGGGTDQIMRNVIAERGLGLPRR